MITKATMSAKTTVNTSRSQGARLPACTGRPGGAGRMRGGGPMRRRSLTAVSRASFLPRMPLKLQARQLRGARSYDKKSKRATQEVRVIEIPPI